MIYLKTHENKELEPKTIVTRVWEIPNVKKKYLYACILCVYIIINKWFSRTSILIYFPHFEVNFDNLIMYLVFAQCDSYNKHALC